MQSVAIENENLKILNIKLYKNKIPKEHTILIKKGNQNRGFVVLKIKNKILIHVYNFKSEILVEDMKKPQSMLIIHLVFLLLFISQFLLYIRVKKSLNPLSLMQKKLETLKDGDLTPLPVDSHYDEIKQMISSYNKSIEKMKYILNMREMFNKIFMHEMKTPIAKGMFYLKLGVSQKTHDKLGKILYALNQELNEFLQIESLIVYQEKISDTKNRILTIIDEAIHKVGIENKNKILIDCDTKSYLKGDKDLWILCFKNIIDNALKYSSNNKLKIECSKNKISFINEGDSLPLNLSKEITNWKIEKNKRHKSSTGYGFGLFIIKTIININGYKLYYIFDDKKKILILKIE